MIKKLNIFCHRKKIVTAPRCSKEVAIKHKTKPNESKAKPKKEKGQAIKKRKKSVTQPIR